MKTDKIKSIRREKIQLKNKSKPKGGTLAGQKRKMQISKFYDRKKA